jgi:hypothetical protein
MKSMVLKIPSFYLMGLSGRLEYHSFVEKAMGIVASA